MVKFVIGTLLLFLLPIHAMAVDIDGNGLDQLFFFSGESVSVHDSSGTLLSRISIPPSAVEDPPVLFQGKSGTDPIVFSLVIKKGREATLYAFSPEGQEAQLSLGKLRKSSVIIANHDENPSSDIFYSDAKGRVFVINNPLEESPTPLSLGIKKKRFERFFLYSKAPLTIGTYGTRRKSSRFITLHSDSSRVKTTLKAPPRSTLFGPHTDLPPSAPAIIIAEKFKKKTQRYSYTLISPQTGASQIVSQDHQISPGVFIANSGSSSASQQFAVSNGLNIEYFSLSSPDTQLGTASLDFGNEPPPPPPSGSNGSENSSNGNCVGDVPQETLTQIAVAFQSGNIFVAQQLLQQLLVVNFCPEVMEEIIQFLQSIVSGGNASAQLASHYTLLGTPTVSTHNFEKKQGGCDKVRDSDGFGGWILKESDVNGNLVTLSPGFYNTTEAALVTFGGKVIEKLTYTGYSNPDHTGLRGTFRASSAPHTYPKKLIVRFQVSTGFSGESEFWCFRSKNSHARND